MTNQKTEPLEPATQPTEIGVGTPVEWMVDPDQREKILGVTYEFSNTGERKTVWYTPNKRRAKSFVVVDVPHSQDVATV
jgi:hypothetical protein